MKNFLDFILAALPWLCLGLLLAIFFAKSAKKEKSADGGKETKDTYMTEGMCIGMCLGTALGSSFGGSTGIGLSLGMLLGLVVGSCIEKKEDDK